MTLDVTRGVDNCLLALRHRTHAISSQEGGEAVKGSTVVTMIIKPFNKGKKSLRCFLCVQRYKSPHTWDAVSRHTKRGKFKCTRA